MLDLLKEWEARSLADNVPLALGELSELILVKTDAGHPPAIYIAVPSKILDQRVREWAQREMFDVTSYQHTIGTVLRISWGPVDEETINVDAQFLHNGKLVFVKSH